MTDHIVPLERFRDARRVLDGRIHRTPILSSSTAARVLAAGGVNVADGRIYAKAEHLQKTGAFKIRGALNKMGSLSAAERAAGVITLSAGNHAQGVALAAHEAGVHAVVMMPAGAVRSKVDACVGYGADVILYGRNVGETWARMDEVQAERGLTFVPPFDDPWILAGQGTIGLEILEDCPAATDVFVPVGGGGLIAGIGAAIKIRRSDVRIVGVEPAASAFMKASLRAGKIVSINEGPTAADAVAGGIEPGSVTLGLCREYVDEMKTVGEDRLKQALFLYGRWHHRLVEGAGGLALAACLKQKRKDRNRTIVLIASGGNIDPLRWSRLTGLRPGKR